MHRLFGILGGLVGTFSGDARGTRVLAVEDLRNVSCTVVGIHFELPLGGPFPVPMLRDWVGGPYTCAGSHFFP